MSRHHTQEKRSVSAARIKLKLIVSAFILLVLALGFGALLTMSSLEKLYVSSIVSEYQVVGKDLQRNLEQALRFGKNIQKFVGMNRMLEETKENLTSKIGIAKTPPAAESDLSNQSQINVSVALPDGTILYSANEGLVGTALPPKIVTLQGDSERPESSYAKVKGAYYVVLPVQGREPKPVAAVVMMFDQGQIAPFLDSILKHNLVVIGAILLASTILLVLLLNLVASAGENGARFSKVKISVVIFLVIGAAQICFSVMQTNAFKKHYLTIAKDKSATLTALLREDVEYLLSKGIRMDKLVKMDVLMGEIIHASPEVSDITIYNADDRPLYVATEKGVIDFQKAKGEEKPPSVIEAEAADPAYALHLDIKKAGQVEGHISTQISKTFVNREIKATVLDSATVLFISILFLVELLILTLQFIEHQLDRGGGQAVIDFGIMRPAAFLFLFGVDIGMSFIPLHMENLYQPILGLSKDIVMGIPISTRVLFTGISIFAGGSWGDRRGWHEPFLGGLFLAGLGFIYAWLAPDAGHFILSQAILGLGYGFSLIAAQLFVIAYTTDRNRARGLAQLWAGVYAGSICGGAAGAMLAERMGYSKVFLIGAIILFCIIPYTLLFMRTAIVKPEARQVEEPTSSLGLGQVFRFLTNRNISSLILFSSIPASIALVGFIDYFSPIYLNRIGSSQSNIGRVLMIYGACLIYIAPFVSKYVDEAKGRKGFIVVSGLLGGLAFIVFYFFSGLLATSLAVLLLGLSSSFGFASQSTYALKLKVTQQLGEGKAMGLFSSADRVGQTLGPVAFGWALIALGTSKGVIYFGVAYLLITILFLVFAQNDSNMAVVQEKQLNPADSTIE